MKFLDAFRFLVARALSGFALSLSLALAGCVGVPAAPDAAVTHPGNMRAEQGSVPPPTPVLMKLTNMVLAPMSATRPAPDHQHGSGEPETKPKNEEKK